MTVQPSELELVAPSTVGAPAEHDDMGGKSKSQGRQALDRFLHSPLSMTGLIVFLLIVLTSYIAPIFYKFKYNLTDPNLNPKHLSVGPGVKGHPLGTDETGFDTLARLMRGTQRDFVMMLISTAIALFIGILIGSLAGYYGRVVDNVLMRFVDIMLTVPALVILILVCARYPQYASHPEGIAVMFGLFGWMGLSRLVRAQFLSLKEREFVEAARAMGASDFRIIFRHLIPNTLSTILVFGTIFAATSIVVETSITYLGYGVHPPDTSLGLLVSKGVDAAETRPWLFYYPGILIVLIVLSVNLVGEGIRNAFDPRNNRVRD
jgi:peptide/nickel transport system permease protein